MRALSDAVRSEHKPFDGCRIGDAKEQNIAFSGERFRRQCKPRDRIDGVFYFIGGTSPDVEIVAGVQQIERHWHAHGAEADKPNSRAWFAVRHIRLL